MLAGIPSAGQGRVTGQTTPPLCEYQKFHTRTLDFDSAAVILCEYYV
jgi:hypothetical protein